MKTTINRHEFRDAFLNLRPENFTYAGLDLLFDYLEQYEEETGTELDFDVIAICCDYYEQEAAAINEEYDLGLDLADLDDDEAAELVAEALQDQTSVVGTTPAGTVIFQAF